MVGIIDYRDSPVNYFFGFKRGFKEDMFALCDLWMVRDLICIAGNKRLGLIVIDRDTGIEK